mmetsp:Transcript_34645/g.69299  ORF Transcript_34645/g.69299 Transcript_34645/m.69299 type:complete len:205 (-) Transcript_34645:68-682(-)
MMFEHPRSHSNRRPYLHCTAKAQCFPPIPLSRHFNGRVPLHRFLAEGRNPHFPGNEARRLLCRISAPIFVWFSEGATSRVNEGGNQPCVPNSVGHPLASCSTLPKYHPCDPFRMTTISSPSWMSIQCEEVFTSPLFQSCMTRTRNASPSCRGGACPFAVPTEELFPGWLMSPSGSEVPSPHSTEKQSFRFAPQKNASMTRSPRI